MGSKAEKSTEQKGAQGDDPTLVLNGEACEEDRVEVHVEGEIEAEKAMGSSQSKGSKGSKVSKASKIDEGKNGYIEDGSGDKPDDKSDKSDKSDDRSDNRIEDLSANVSARVDNVNCEDPGNIENKPDETNEMEAITEMDVTEWSESENAEDENGVQSNEADLSEKPKGTPRMTTRSGKNFGHSIRKTLFKSAKSATMQRRSLSMSISKRGRSCVTPASRKRKMSGGSPLLPNKKQILMDSDDLFNKIQSMLRESELRQTKVIMAAIEKKQEEGLKELRKTATSLKKEQKEFIKEQREKVLKIESDQQTLKESFSSHEKVVKKVEKEVKQLNNKLQTNKSELEKSMEAKKRYIDVEIVDTKDLLKKAQETAKESRTKIHERIDLCVGRVSTVENNIQEITETMNTEGLTLNTQEFPVKSTAIAKFVKQPDGVSPTKIGEIIINEALELEDVKVVRVKSMSRNEKKIGTLKIQLESAADLHTVLSAKRKLAEFDEDPEMKSVKLRQSKTHEQLVAEQNADAMLKALDLYGDFYRTDKGFLLPRDQQRRKDSWRQENQYRDNNDQRPSGSQQRRGGGQGNRRGNNRGQPRNKPRNGSNKSRTSAHNRESDDHPPRRQLSRSSRDLWSANSENGRGYNADRSEDKD